MVRSTAVAYHIGGTAAGDDDVVFITYVPRDLCALRKIAQQDMQFNVRPVFGYGLHGVSQAAVGDNSKHFCLHSATSLCIQYDCNT